MVPSIVPGNYLFRLAGIIRALPSAEISATLLGLILWLGSSPGIMAIPSMKRSELARAE